LLGVYRAVAGIDGQNLADRVFPQSKDAFPGKSQVVGMFLAEKPPFAVLLYGVGCRDKAKRA
jgi:hypothetical protein